MYEVYVLYSERCGKIYIGVSANVEQRFLSHNSMGKKGWTINYRPWQIVYREKFALKKEAIQREKALKTARGRRFIWKTVIKSHLKS